MLTICKTALVTAICFLLILLILQQYDKRTSVAEAVCWHVTVDWDNMELIDVFDPIQGRWIEADSTTQPPIPTAETIKQSSFLYCKP